MSPRSSCVPCSCFQRVATDTIAETEYKLFPEPFCGIAFVLLLPPYLPPVSPLVVTMTATTAELTSSSQPTYTSPPRPTRTLPPTPPARCRAFVLAAGETFTLAPCPRPPEAPARPCPSCAAVEPDGLERRDSACSHGGYCRQHWCGGCKKMSQLVAAALEERRKQQRTMSALAA